MKETQGQIFAAVKWNTVWQKPSVHNPAKVKVNVYFRAHLIPLPLRVPETMQKLSNASLQELQLEVNPLERDTNHGISLYIRPKEFLSQQN